MAQWTRLIIAIFIAVWAQKVVSTGQHLLDGLILFGAAVALFVANAPAPREDDSMPFGYTIPIHRPDQANSLSGSAVLTVEALSKDAGSAKPRPSTGSGRSEFTLSHRTVGLAGLAVALTAVAAALLWSCLSNPVGLALWLGGLALFLVALWPATNVQRRPASSPKVFPKLEFLVLAFILLAALLARSSALDTVPNGLQSDEGNNGLEALKWLSDAPYSPYAEANEGQATLFTYLIALSFKLFGISVPSMRLVSAVAGTLTVAAFYVLAREFFRPRAALVGTGLLAASRWHLTFSRIIYELILVPFCAIWLFYFLHRGLRDGRRRDFVLAGYALALGLNTYTAFRVVPLGVALLALYWLVRRRQQFRATLRGLGLFALSSIMGLVPLGIYAIQRPKIVLIRTKHISISNDIERAGSLAPLWSNVRKYLLMFNVQGDGGSSNNLPGVPMLDLVVAALFILGLAYAFRHWRQPKMFLPIAWAVGVLPAGIFSVAREAPSARRVIGLVPVVYLLVTPVVDALWRASLRAWRGRGHRLWAFGFGVLAVAVGVSNLLTYFTVQARHPSVWRAFSPHEAAIGQYIARLDRPAFLYLSSVYNEHSAITFIAHDPEYNPLDLSQHLPVRQPQETDVIYILEPADRRLEPLFHQFYPAGLWKEHLDPYGGLLFNTFEITPAQQAKAMGLEARYHPNAEWQSPAAFIRRDDAIDFDWREDPPLPYPFSVEWRGALLVPQYGQYGLMIQASGPFTLTLDGEELLSGRAGSHSTQQVLIGGFHAFTLRYVAETGAGGPLLLWEGPVGGQQVVPSLSFYALEVPEFGLVGYYYPNAGWEGSPRVVQRDIFLAAGEVLPAPYSIIWRGKLLVEQAGLYHLGTNSDDGSLLFVDGQLVVDNGGSHGLRYVEGSVNLTAGYHDAELRYFQDGGSRVLELWWTLPEGRRELIPPTKLFPWEGDIPLWQPVEPARTESPLPVMAASQVWQIWTGKEGDGEEGMMEPRDVAVDQRGYVYVADTGNRRVLVFDNEGQFIASWDGGEKKFVEPLALVVDSRGNLYVLDSEPGWIYRFAAHGTPLGRFAGPEARFFHPRGLAIDEADRLYVADTGGCRVVIYNTAGERLGQLGRGGRGLGELLEPTDVALDGRGGLYVVDTSNQRVQQLDIWGGYRAEWPIPAASPYNGPHLALAPDGSLLMTAPERHQIQRYSPDGTLLGEWGSLGVAAGQFRIPVGLVVDQVGNVYVADTRNHRLQKFVLWGEE
jgi:4-amino-4-deoxy-L-arabinose transferase-like glycosyltransferase/sugar lactone lactonase YvrE